MGAMRKSILIATMSGVMGACASQKPVGEDPRAVDAVAFFGSVCGKIVANWGPAVQDDRYRIVELPKDAAAKLGESLAGLTLFSVKAPGSRVDMIQYVTASGICGVEVADADQTSIERAFEALVRSEALGLSMEASLMSEQEHGGDRTRIWRLGTAYEIGISASREGGGPPQHILTMARVRAHQTGGAAGTPPH
jgi:hypothetical protein